MKQNWKLLKGKKFKFILYNGKIYTGHILEVEQRKNLFFISIKTIFNESIGFLSSQIWSYEEIK